MIFLDSLILTRFRPFPFTFGDLGVPTPFEDMATELASHAERVLVLSGAGVACATDRNPCASWTGLLHDGLERCRQRYHTLSEGWFEITEKMIGERTAAELVGAASRIEQALRSI